MNTFYDEGWNARVCGLPYNPRASRAWRDGWADCNNAPPEDRRYMC
jgi:hypothetical protein